MSQNKVIHLKGLNSIRAIAALAVVFSHIYHFNLAFGLPDNSLDLADYGVTIFFTLSGYLITYLLLIEKDQYKNIAVKEFYIRRVLRIWPLYYFYLLLAIVILYIFQKEEIVAGQLPFYFLLSANIPFILGVVMPVINHFWSLGVEEQFYLFWPWIVKKTDNVLKWAAIFVIVFLVLKASFWFLYYKTGYTTPLYAVHITRFHCMAIGACGAILYFNRNQLFFKISYSLLTQLIVLISLFLAAVNKFKIAAIVNHEIISIVTVFLIVNVSANPKTIIRLDNKVLNFLGKISYGIYVYHLLLIYLASKWIAPSIREIDSQYRYMVISLIIVAVTVAVAWLSYTFFEKPFLNRKEVFSRVKSSSNGIKS